MLKTYLRLAIRTVHHIANKCIWYREWNFIKRAQSHSDLRQSCGFKSFLRARLSPRLVHIVWNHGRIRSRLSYISCSSYVFIQFAPRTKSPTDRPDIRSKSVVLPTRKTTLKTWCSRLTYVLLYVLYIISQTNAYGIVNEISSNAHRATLTWDRVVGFKAFNARNSRPGLYTPFRIMITHELDYRTFHAQVTSSINLHRVQSHLRIDRISGRNQWCCQRVKPH